MVVARSRLIEAEHGYRCMEACHHLVLKGGRE
jgi:hypothetical protein